MSAKNLELSNRESVRNFLRRYADGRYRNAVVEFLPDSGAYLVFVPSEIQPFTDKARRMLERRAFKEIDVHLQVAQFSAKTDSRTSAALIQILEPILGNNLIEVAVSTPTTETAEVLVFVRNLANVGAEQQAARAKITDFLKTYDLLLERCYFNELADGIPSHFQILRIIYTISPASFEDIRHKLETEQTPAPTTTWLKRQLDQLIRQSLIIWQYEGIYCLTAMGIAMLPARKGKSSPDIKRALELARKMW